MARKAKSRMNGQPTANGRGDDTVLDPIEEAIRETEAIEMAAETMTGDLRDFILDRLRFEQSKRPWHERSEQDQRVVVHEVEAAVQTVVRKALEIMAGHGRRTISGTVEQVTVKDGYKAVLTMSRFDENRHAMSDAVGCAVMVVIADPEVFTGERETVAIIPDQNRLQIEGAMAQHSEGSGEPQQPF